MFGTRVPPPGAARRPRRLRPIAWGLLLAAAACLAGAAGAQPTPPPLGDPVARLRDILTGEAGPDLAARQKEVTGLIDGMDLEELSRVLLLQEWRTLENSVPRTKPEQARKEADLQARNHAADRFRQLAKEALQRAKGQSMLAKAATADLIGETADAGRKLDYLARVSSGTGAPGAQPPPTLADQLSDLTGDLIDLTKPGGPGDREDSTDARRAAAHALGEIQPADPKKVIGALEDLLADRTNPRELRATAARSLDLLAQSSAKEMQDSLGLDRTFTIQNRFADVSEAVWLAVLRQGLVDQPPEVRRASLSAFGHLAAQMLDISVLPDANPPPVSEADSPFLKDMEAKSKHFYQRLADVFGVYDQHADVMKRAVQDNDPETRRMALSVLVDLGNARAKLQGLTTGGVRAPTPGTPPGAPPPTEGKIIKPRAAIFLGGTVALTAFADEPDREKSQKQALDDLTRGLGKTLDAVRDQLRAPDPQTRLEALDLVETLGAAAFPTSEAALAKSRALLDALTGSLADPDRFARWAAARTVGNLVTTEDARKLFTADEAAAAAEGLANMMRDEDVSVRLAAANALSKFGRAAHSAGPEPAGPFYSAARRAAPMLARSINRSQSDAALRIVPTRGTEQDLVTGDPSIRVASMRALQAIASPETVGALKEAEVALGDRSTQVRQAAAEMIGRVGPHAPGLHDELVQALGNALNDPEGDVRRAVSGALLRLMPAKPK